MHIPLDEAPGTPSAEATHLSCGSLPSLTKALCIRPPGHSGKEMGNYPQCPDLGSQDLSVPRILI